MTPRHLALVGLMGAGKTTVGEECARRLGRPFLDTDELIERTTGRTVAEIFQGGGEPAFRALERQAIADACASPAPLVISCGGGAVLDAGNRALLRATALVVWLRAPPSVLAARLQADGAVRPLLEGRGADGELERLAAARESAYEATASVAIDTDALTVSEVTDAVLEELSRCLA